MGEFAITYKVLFFNVAAKSLFDTKMLCNNPEHARARATFYARAYKYRVIEIIDMRNDIDVYDGYGYDIF